MLVKHIIAQCTVAHGYVQITITALDACRWIDLAWTKVTITTISNTFHKVGFVHILRLVATECRPLNLWASNPILLSSMHGQMRVTLFDKWPSSILSTRWTTWARKNQSKKLFRNYLTLSICYENYTYSRRPNILNFTRCWVNSSRRWRMFIWTGSHPGKAELQVIPGKIDLVHRFVNKTWTKLS